jgi:hypothetical protein
LERSSTGIVIHGETRRIADPSSTVSFSVSINERGNPYLLIHSTDDRDRRRASVITFVHGDDPWRRLREIVEAGGQELEGMKAKWQRVENG